MLRTGFSLSSEIEEYERLEPKFWIKKKKKNEYSSSNLFLCLCAGKTKIRPSESIQIGVSYQNYSPG